MSLYPRNGFDETFQVRRNVHAWFFIGILMGLVVAVLVSLTILALQSASPETTILVGVFDVSVVVALIRRYVVWRRTSFATGPRSRELRCIGSTRDPRRARWLASHPDRSRGGRSTDFSLRFHPGI